MGAAASRAPTRARGGPPPAPAAALAPAPTPAPAEPPPAPDDPGAAHEAELRRIHTRVHHLDAGARRNMEEARALAPMVLRARATHAGVPKSLQTRLERHVWRARIMRRESERCFNASLAIQGMTVETETTALWSEGVRVMRDGLHALGPEQAKRLAERAQVIGDDVEELADVQRELDDVITRGAETVRAAACADSAVGDDDALLAALEAELDALSTPPLATSRRAQGPTPHTPLQVRRARVSTALVVTCALPRLRARAVDRATQQHNLRATRALRHRSTRFRRRQHTRTHKGQRLKALRQR